QVVQRL
ncbi:hypothetical protein BN1723_020913, partial [Verticillium longisporum]